MKTDNQVLTIKEFKMWLQGVEEMQSDDWCPNPIQWKKIRDKITELADAPTPVQPAQTLIRGAASPVEFHRPPEFAGPPVMAAPSALPMAQRDHFIPPPVLSSNPHQPVKTPMIDTSNGNYNPAFA